MEKYLKTNLKALGAKGTDIAHLSSTFFFLLRLKSCLISYLFSYQSDTELCYDFVFHFLPAEVHAVMKQLLSIICSGPNSSDHQDLSSSL